MNVKVSIVIINYNGEQWLPFAIESCLRQSFTDIEIIVVDDCSTDTSWDILQAYSQKHPTIVPLRVSQNLGISGARNTGMAKATGEYIALLDSDDVFLPESIENYVRVFFAIKKQHPDLVMLSTDAWIINERGKRKGRYMTKEWFGKLEVHNPPLWTLPSSWFFQKSVQVTFCEYYRVGEAPLFIARMNNRGKIGFWGEPNLDYRICQRSVSNTSGAAVVRAMNAAEQSVKEGRLENPLRPEEVPIPSWRQRVTWTYGRNAKAAMVNARWGKAGVYVLGAAMANFPLTVKKVLAIIRRGRS